MEKIIPEKWLENPAIKIIAIFFGVIGGLLLLIQFYNSLPISYTDSSSIEVALKIIIMAIILIVGMIIYLVMEMRKNE